MNNNTVETLIGAAVVAIAGLFFFYAYNASGAGEGRNGYHITAEFDNIEGVNTGTDVRMAGIKIGTVVDQKLNPENYQAVVTMVIDPNIQISDDASAKITAEGLLGAKFVALEPGGSETKLAEGGVLSYTQGAIDLWSLISKAMFDKSSEQPPQPAPAPAQ